MTISKTKMNNKRVIFIIITLYAFFLMGFFLNEDSSGGAIMDFTAYQSFIKSFVLDFKYSFFNFDEFGERHSPILIMFLSIFYKLNIDETIIRFVNFNFSTISIFFFINACLSNLVRLIKII